MLEQWQTFQVEFGKYLRDPAQQPLPSGVIPRRAKVYEDLLFNNVCGFLNSCFPVCKTLIEEDDWLTLSRGFFRDWRCHSPRFNDIPKEFLDYLISDMSLEIDYPWFIQLAHYEWVELAVDTFDESGAEKHIPDDKPTIRVTPSLHNLIYDWPVHQISHDFLPTEIQQTFLLVFRTPSHEVSFTQINAPTSALINLFEQGYINSEDALSELAKQMNVPFNSAFKTFGFDIVKQLLEQGVLIDT